MEKQVLKIDGIACGHCKATVEKAIQAVPGVETVEVDLAAGVAEVTGAGLDTAQLENAVVAEGFRIKSE